MIHSPAPVVTPHPAPSRVPLLVLALALLLTALATGFVAYTAHARDRARFENAVQSTYDRVERRMRVYTALLRGGSALFAASDSVAPAEFRAYVQRLDLDRNYPGVQGLGFSRRVAADGERERHRIVYLEPLDDRNRAALGFDMFSEPTRRAAMRRARDTGLPALSGRVRLRQEIRGRPQPGFLVYLPVYAGGSIPGTVAERRARLQGFVYSPFRADDLFAGVFGTERRPEVAFHVYDGPRVEPGALLHDSRREGTAPSRSPQFTEVVPLTVAGRRWAIAFATTPAFDAGSGGPLAPGIAVLGVLASLMLYLTARREAEAREAAERSAAEAEAANRAKSEFLATMSHELRTPLNAIAGYAELMELGIRGPVTDTQREDLRRIKRSQHYLTSLIGDILNYARLEAGRVEFRPADVALRPVIADAHTLTEPQLRAGDLNFEAVIQDPALAVRADEDKLRQVLLNLLTNAIKFTPAGGRISLTAEPADGEVRIHVADTGRGIPPERLDGIWDPFVQVDRDLTRSSQLGVGLGLAISRELARGMGGEISVRSAVGEGSVFTLTLPRAGR